MNPRVTRWVGKAGLVVVSSVALATAALAASAPANAARSTANPYSPSYQHPYRHGAVPTREQQAKIEAYDALHPAIHPNSTNNLNFGGGIDGIGVTIGAPKVYLIFWGNGWGTQSTDANGNLTFSADSAGAAPRLQMMFKGLGTGGELWSGIPTQYCEGVATGTQICGTAGTHIGYPTGGNLAGVWYDNSAVSTSTNGHQIAVEAIAAASHFGNTTAALNRSAQYVVLSPTGYHPDGFNNPLQWCAWHDWNGDTTLTGGSATSTVGDIAFTNMPYVLDAGTSCGQNFVNASGPLDGYTMVEGHEYMETITDQNPAGGYTDSTGAENGDKCAWVAPTAQGGAANVAMGNGSYAEQGGWSNDSVGGTGQCEISHAIVTGGGAGSPTVTNPGTQTGTVGVATSLTVTATGGTTPYTWSATGLPAGLSIASGTGVISGTPTTSTTYSVTVTATDAAAKTGSATFSWTINPAGGGSGITNGGFETGTFSGWTTSGASVTIASSGAHSGTYAGLAGAATPTNGDSNIVQTFTVPAGFSSLSFWYNMTCPDSITYDWATATLVDNSTATTTTPLPKICTTGGWTQVASSVVAGHSYTLTLTSHDDNYATDPSRTLFDDITLTAPVSNPIVNGGFETGSFSGWTTSGVAPTLVSTGAHSGTYAARAGSTAASNGDSNVAQTFTAPGGTLSFWYDVICPDTVTYDWATATLKDNTTNVTTTILAKTCVANSGWTKVSAALTAGHSYTLTLTSHDDNYATDPTYTLFDDVSVG
jgi:hypothetical protein